MGVDVRRLATVDVHGLKGTRFRAWVITAEFVVGAVGGPLLSAALLAGASSVGWTLFEIWVLTVTLNYVPLAFYAIGFLRSGQHREELADADIRAELRRYTLAQMWVFMPLALIVMDLRQRRSAP